MNAKWLKKIALLALVVCGVILYKYFGISEYLSLESLKLRQDSLNAYYDQHSMQVIGAFALLYIV
ncbi:MAG: hypothetical protein ACXVCE_12405, partial [Bacteriovorax sp.]